MHQNIDILSLSKAIQFFKTPLTSQSSSKQLETSISILQHIAGQPDKQPSPIYHLLIPQLAKRYYQLGTSKTEIFKEEFLLVRFVHLVRSAAEVVLADCKKDLIVILMSATVSLTKKYFERVDLAFTDLKVALLQLNFYLLSTIVKRVDFKIEEIYPKEYSLCSSILKQANLGLKNFNLCVKAMIVLVQHNQKIINSVENTTFLVQCAKRLLQDIRFLSNIFNKLELAFQETITHFAQTLLNITINAQKPKNLQLRLQRSNQEVANQNIKKEMFAQTILLAQICKIGINLTQFDKYRRSVITQSYKNVFLQTCNTLLNVRADIQLKKREINKLGYLLAQIQLAQDETVTNKAIKLLSFIFSIKRSHQLITIPNHSTTIPLQPIQAHHSLENYPIKALEKEYKSEFYRMLVQVIEFIELQPLIVAQLEQLFKQIRQANRECLVKHFSDELLKQEYQLNMSLTKLYTHLEMLFILRFLLNSQQTITLAPTLSIIFLTLAAKIQTLRSLKATYIEQQLLIAVTLEIAFKCYLQLNRLYKEEGSIQKKIKSTQNSILVVQKILNQLSQDSYLIRLITTHTILQFSGNSPLSQALQPLQATLILRNKNNLPLMVNLLNIAHLNQTDLEELAQFYMQYRSAENVLRLLLPKLRIETARKCILTVQRWWLLLTKEVVSYLNCKEMEKDQKQQSFPLNDGQNVAIKNVLGVIIIELQQKWTFYLRSQKRQSIIDILISLLQVNPKMVFFRSKFTKVIVVLCQILRQTLGLEQVSQILTKKEQLRESKKQKQSLIQPQKVEFYNRLRLKIYKLLDLVPQECYQVYSKEDVQALKELINDELQKIKREYLFEGKLQLSSVYEQLKRITTKLEVE